MIEKQVTDTSLIKTLQDMGINPDDCEFSRDYAKEHPTTKFYRSPKGRIAVCQGLPKVRPDGVKICGNAHNETTVGWTKVGKNYKGKPNIFEAKVEGELVKLSYNGKDLKWQPQVFLDGVEQSCEDATLLGIDPTNENYRNNVLDWNYRCCRRRLRVIEGGIFDRKIVESNPHGEVRVKVNQSGDLKLQLSGAIDAEGNPLGRVEGDEEIVSAEEFDKAVYPVTIGDSLTVYSTASDALVEVDEASTTWTAVREASGETILFATSIYIQTQTNFVAPARFIIRRTFLYFDTLALGAGAVISAATLSLYEYGTQTETDEGHADNAITQGVQDDPLVASNYGDQFAYSTRGSDTDFAYPLTASAYNDKALNSDGYGWISLTGTTKFCLRLSGDLDNLTPTASNLMTFYANEGGAGKLPKLVITYIINYVRTAPVVAIGLVPTASRSLILYRSATKAIGLVPTASRALVLYRSASKAIGLVGTASRVLVLYRSATKAIGLVGRASRVLVLYRTATVAIGLVPTASRFLALYRTAPTVAIGLKARASFLWRHLRQIQPFTNVRSIVSATVRTISSFTNVRKIR